MLGERVFQGGDMTRFMTGALLCVLSLLIFGCSGGGSSGGSSSGGGGGGGGTPPAPAPELGTGDHSPSSVTFTPVGLASYPYSDPMDLDFSNHASNELWVVNQANESIVIIDDVTAGTLTGDKLDASDEVGAWGHFLQNVSGIAMGAQTSGAGNGWTMATSQDGNNGGNNFMGPTLWSSDRTVMGVTPNPLPSQWNTSHLDMLHSTTWGKGICHQSGNIYWTIGICYDTIGSGSQVSIAKYNFNADHTPGQSNHVDGEKYHYVIGQVGTTSSVHTGMIYDAGSGMLYVSDSANGRLVRLDTNSGTAGSTPISSFSGDGVDYEVTGATLTNVVSPGGNLTTPSGLELYNNTLYVADYATGYIHAFDLSGSRINYLDTGVGANALQGIKMGPDGKLYFCDSKNDQVIRIDP
jgi:hypothetical protein